ncbi:MAG: MBL fold metallo-hydrolase [Dehalococcoidales bacterium]|nr:MBL fold metallo-hydrolase [Dehalococcoidales bacterium]
MATAIIPGICELLVPIPYNPLENTNIYLLRGNDGYLLIDTGWNSDDSFRALGEELADAGADFKDIKQIVVTHAHFDHYGLTGRIHQLSKAKIYMHHMDEEIFRTRYAVTEEYMRQSEDWFYSNGVPRHEMPISRMSYGGPRATGLPQQPDVHLNGGETISTGIFNLKVIWTPGHSPGHICLYEPKHKLFFSGDHVLPVITPNISLPPGSPGNPLADFLKSLELVRNLDVTTVLPAHENIFHDLPKRVDEIIHHHEVRTDEILETLGTGAKTAYEISGFITWMPELGGVKFRNLMPGDQRSAVSETLAHLRAITVDGKVKVTTRNNVFYYQCT